MDRDGLIKASFHAGREHYHQEQLKAQKDKLALRPAETRGLSYTERFDNAYETVLLLLSQTEEQKPHTAPTIPVRDAVEGSQVEVWLNFHVRGEGDARSIGYCAFNKDSQGQPQPVALQSSTRSTLMFCDTNNMEDWPPLSDIEGTLEVYLREVDQLNSEELITYGFKTFPERQLRIDN